jgi:transcriptional regulator with XRE-family HTH domain
MSPFAETLRRLRFELGLKQQDIAEVAGCDRSYLSAIENDLRPAPSAKFIDVLIRAMRLSDTDAEKLRGAQRASAHVYRVPREAPADVYLLVNELFSKMDTLSAGHVAAIRAVLGIGGAELDRARRAPDACGQVGQDERMEETM